MLETKVYSITLLEKKTLTHNVFELRFTKPEHFVFQAGQFVHCEIPLGGAGAPVMRPYSLSSTPADPYLEFCVKYIPGGHASEYFSAMEIGQILTIHGPLGFFIVKGYEMPLFCIATGVGLAPLMGIVRDECENMKRDTPVQLLFGVRTQEDIFWQDRLEQLAKHYPNFSYNITLSQVSAPPLPLLYGRVTAHLPGATADKDYFICGNVDMVKDVRSYLIARGVSMRGIHFEIF